MPTSPYRPHPTTKSCATAADGRCGVTEVRSRLHWPPRWFAHGGPDDPSGFAFQTFGIYQAIGRGVAARVTGVQFDE
jgi:hypothetical protein